MRNLIYLVALLGGVSQTSIAAEHPLETCAQVRAKIGVLPLADPDFLRELAVRKDCRISSSEFYKAAYGGELPPPRETTNYLRAGEEDDD